MFGLKGSWVSLRKPLFGEKMSLPFTKVQHSQTSEAELQRSVEGESIFPLN